MTDPKQDTIAALAMLAGVPTPALAELLERHWRDGDAEGAGLRLRELRLWCLAPRDFTAPERIRLAITEMRDLGLPVGKAVLEAADLLGLSPAYVRSAYYRKPGAKVHLRDAGVRHIARTD